MRVTNRFKLVYVDTSVVNGMFDHTEQTSAFLNMVVNGEVRILVSALLRDELKGAPKEVQKFFANLPESQIVRAGSNENTDKLATRYITEGIVSEKHIDDCRHIAIATVNNADCLVSWNFRHIVNANRIYRYNAI